MDRATASEIAHGDLGILNPLPEHALAGAIDLLELAPGTRVVDIGCGRGEALIRVAERRPGIRGLGLDLHAPYIEQARAEATARAAGSELAFEAADAQVALAGAEPFDLAIMIGASHALGGDYRHALTELARIVAPGGQALLGEGYWRRDPAPEYLAALGAATDELTGYAGLLRAAGEAGFTPLHAQVASEQDFDRYEWGLVLSAERWAASHPDGAGPVLDYARELRERMLAPGGRETLGFGLFLLRRD